MIAVHYTIKTGQGESKVAFSYRKNLVSDEEKNYFTAAISKTLTSAGSEMRSLIVGPKFLK